MHDDADVAEEGEDEEAKLAVLDDVAEVVRGVVAEVTKLQRQSPQPKQQRLHQTNLQQNQRQNHPHQNQRVANPVVRYHQSQALM